MDTVKTDVALLENLVQEDPIPEDPVKISLGAPVSAIQVTSSKGTYTILEQIGKGGFGTTFKATFDPVGGSSSETVCLKRFRFGTRAHDHITGESKGQELFRREGEVLAALNHPAFPHFHEAFTIPGEGLREDENWIAMEYLPGRTLREIGCVSLDEALQYADKMLESLSVLHAQGMYHRDVKPDNIIIQNDGTVRIVDLGTVALRDNPKTYASTIAGTSGYAAIEQFQPSQRKKDFSSADIYSVGATLYYLLTGEDPECDLRKQHVVLPEKFPKEVQNLVQLMTYNYALLERRIQTADEARRRITALLVKEKHSPDVAQPKEMRRVTKRGVVRSYIEGLLAPFLVHTLSVSERDTFDQRREFSFGLGLASHLWVVAMSMPSFVDGTADGTAALSVYCGVNAISHYCELRVMNAVRENSGLSKKNIPKLLRKEYAHLVEEIERTAYAGEGELEKAIKLFTAFTTRELLPVHTNFEEYRTIYARRRAVKAHKKIRADINKTLDDFYLHKRKHHSPQVAVASFKRRVDDIRRYAREEGILLDEEELMRLEEQVIEVAFPNETHYLKAVIQNKLEGIGLDPEVKDRCVSIVQEEYRTFSDALHYEMKKYLSTWAVRECYRKPAKKYVRDRLAHYEREARKGMLHLTSYRPGIARLKKIAEAAELEWDVQAEGAINVQIHRNVEMLIQHEMSAYERLQSVPGERFRTCLMQLRDEASTYAIAFDVERMNAILKRNDE